MTEQEIVEVVRGCSENNRKHQEYLYKTTYNSMMSMVKRYIDCPYIAEEILHNGYLRIYKNIDKFSFQGSFEGWMKKIMFHAVSNAVRQDSRIITKHSKGFTQKVDMDETYRQELITTMPDYASHKDLINLVESLPSKTGGVFRMYLMGFSHLEISKKFNIREGTSKWHVSEARKLLKAQLA